MTSPARVVDDGSGPASTSHLPHVDRDPAVDRVHVSLERGAGAERHERVDEDPELTSWRRRRGRRRPPRRDAEQQHLADRAGGNLRILTPTAEVGKDDLWMRDTDMCCGVRKVAPLEQLLSNRSSWVTGLRRDDGPTRANTPIVLHDVLRDVIKVNPIANWTDADVARSHEPAETVFSIEALSDLLHLIGEI